MNPIIIIGSGMAGYTLAREFRKLNSDTPLTIITADDGVNYAKPTLSNALAGKKTAATIGLADHQKMADQLQAIILNHTRVLRIDHAQRQIEVEQGAEKQHITYHSLILAVGANPIRLPIGGDGAKDILAVNSLSDYTLFREQLEQPAMAGRSLAIAILGAGLIGCEFANDLKSAGHDVTVIDLAARPLGRLLPEVAGAHFQQQLEVSGIRFALGTTVVDVSLNPSEAELPRFQLTLANGQQIQADVVLSAVGLRPELGLATVAGLATDRGIRVDALLQTSEAGIYAVGDCAEVQGHLLPYVMPIMQQARALAQTLNGTPTPVHYPAMPVSVKTPAAPLVVLPPPSDLADVRWESELLDDGLIARAMDDTGLRGFVLLGPTAGKQRLALTKQVPDLIPLAAV